MPSATMPSASASSDKHHGDKRHSDKHHSDKRRGEKHHGHGEKCHKKSRHKGEPKRVHVWYVWFCVSQTPIHPSTHPHVSHPDPEAPVCLRARPP